MKVDQEKQAIREKVWKLLEQEHATPTGAAGRIPAFVGAEHAAARLAQLPQWTSAKVLKAVPDTAQEPVRARALNEGKLLYMAVPKLAEAKPFYLLDPATLTHPTRAAHKNMAAQIARTVDVDEMRPVDMIVCGSVAVNRAGTRLGKGAGYSDIEVALLQEAGLISPDTVIVTTVHPLQVLDTDLPETDHDFSVDIIVTPHEVIHCPHPRRPTRLIWANLTPEKISAIPRSNHTAKRLTSAYEAT